MSYYITDPDPKRQGQVVVWCALPNGALRLSEHKTRAQALDQIHYLNGGDPPSKHVVITEQQGPDVTELKDMLIQAIPWIERACEGHPSPQPGYDLIRIARSAIE